ncbi:MAG: ion transporter [Phycisphaerales bacterium]
MSSVKTTGEGTACIPQGTYLRARRRTREIMAHGQAIDTPSRVFDTFIVGLILLNVAAMVIESVEHIRLLVPTWFTAFEYFSVAVFSVEYVLRIWSSVEDPAYAKPFLGRLRFAIAPLAMVDLAAVLPFYLPFLGVDLRVLRMFRLFRVMRIMRVAKLARYSDSLQMLLRVVKSRRDQLLGAVFILLILLIVAASLMYYAEHEAQPKVFSSIPAAMWWAAVTLTTVGYGDAYPITPIGKVMASMTAILGIGMFALPTAVLGAGFLEELASHKKTQCCPHCGKEIPS